MKRRPRWPRPARASPDLTPRQRQVFAFLRSTVAERGFPPTIAEIAAHFGMRSPNAAAQHLRLMAKKGAIEIEPGISRGIRLKGEGKSEKNGKNDKNDKNEKNGKRSDSSSLPVIGRVAAGSPILAEENVDGAVALDPRAFRPRADYLLRVAGDSMVGVGILDGDLVAVHRASQAENGAIAVVRVGGDEVTVKRLRRNGARLTLLPENPRMKPIEVDLRTTEAV